MDEELKAVAKHHYTQFADFSKSTEDPLSKKVIHAQATVYAGVYNNDKALAAKGLADFKRRGLRMLEDMAARGEVSCARRRRACRRRAERARRES
jgi:hypothetical protein